MRLIFVFLGTVCYDVLSAEFFLKIKDELKRDCGRTAQLSFYSLLDRTPFDG